LDKLLFVQPFQSFQNRENKRRQSQTSKHKYGPKLPQFQPIPKIVSYSKQFVPNLKTNGKIKPTVTAACLFGYHAIFCPKKSTRVVIMG
jgi:hypothetical protein